MNFEERLSMEEDEPSLNLTPLMDIMFLLVIFFAVSTTFKVFPGISVDLPGAESETDQGGERNRLPQSSRKQGKSLSTANRLKKTTWLIHSARYKRNHP